MEKPYRWNIWKILIALTATVYFFYIARHHTEWHFLDVVDLIFHEAGHTLATAFPPFLHAAAGTIFQLFIPLVCFLHLHYNKNYFSSYIVLFWVGQNFLNVSVYARDAQMMILPLLGGDHSIHDWNYMLNAMNLLRFTDKIADGIFFVAIVTLATAATFSLLNAKDKRQLDVERAI